MDWDDMRLVLSVCRAGTLSGAARDLGVNYSTIFRRICGIEKDLNLKLFERHRDGYAMTEAGEAVMQHAERMEEEANAVSREILGTDACICGTIKLTAPDGVATYGLMPHLESFCKQHPDVQLDLNLTSSSLLLERNEADLAVRIGKRPPENYIAREICKVSFGNYGSPEYIEKYGHLKPHEHRWITNREHPKPFWAGEKDQINVVFTSDSKETDIEAARRGLGLVSLADIAGSRAEGLQRVDLPVKQVVRTMWLLIHPDLRGTARVKALMNHLMTGLQNDKDAFIGAEPAVTSE
jgi:DNA-binding transcriptional LysR family regulator